MDVPLHSFMRREGEGRNEGGREGEREV